MKSTVVILIAAIGLLSFGLGDILTIGRVQPDALFYAAAAMLGVEVVYRSEC